MSSGVETVGLERRLNRGLSSHGGDGITIGKNMSRSKSRALTVLSFEEQSISRLFSIIVYVDVLGTVRTVLSENYKNHPLTLNQFGHQYFKGKICILWGN